MRRTAILFLLLALIGSTLPMGSVPAVRADETTVSGSEQFFRVYIRSYPDLEAMVRLGLDILGGRDDWRDVRVGNHQLLSFRALNLRYEPLVLPTPQGESSTDSFYSYETMVQELTALANAYSPICRTCIIGYTFKGRPIWALKITLTPVLEWDRPRVLITANHHAREWMTTAVAMKLAHYMVENYSTDAGLKTLVDSRETWIVPCLNEDGYVYDTGGANAPSPPGAMWRKNMRDNDQTDGSFANGSDGTDLNRNYGYQWVGSGSSPLPSNETYRGPWAFSEPETQAIRDLMRNRPFLLGLSLHTYSNLVLYPWGYTSAHAWDYALLSSMAGSMADGYSWGGKSYPGNGYTDQQSSQLYPTNGDTDDWAYGFLGIPFFTFEMTPNTFYEPASQIAPTFNNNKEAMLYLIRRAPEVTGAVCGTITDPGGTPLAARIAIAAGRTPNGSDPKTGNYCWTMVPGIYSLTVSCTGYQSVTETVTLEAGVYTKRNFALQPTQSFAIRGQVRDAGGQPLPASLRLANTQRGSIAANPNDGSFVLTDLVPGPYQLKVWASGFQTRWFDINVTGDQNVDVVLSDPSPILLINDDGWGEAGTQIQYYRETLARLGLAYQEWETPARGLPTIQELKNYSQTVWLKPYGGLLPEAQNLLQSYLETGGRLVLSGQDIALSAALQGSFLQTALACGFASDNVNTRSLSGISGDPIGDGLLLNIDHSGGLRDNTYCDSLTTGAGSAASFTYAVGGSPAGAVRTDRSNYRSVFFAFNWEGISVAQQRDTVLARALSWNGSLPNDPPTITSQPPLTATGSVPYTYALTATDPQDDPLGYGLIYHPQGLTISTTGLVTWTPTQGQIGSWGVKLQARDNKGGTVPQAYRLTVSTTATPSLSLLSPNGGESWSAGALQSITWISTGLTGPLQVELNRAYPGSDWETLFAATPNTGSATWTVAGPSSSHCRVRLTCTTPSSVSDLSDQDFAVTAAANPTLAGTVTRNDNGQPAASILLSFSQGGGSTTTASNGAFLQSLPYGWSGTVSPSASLGGLFVPPSRSYTNLTQDLSNQDFQWLPPRFQLLLQPEPAMGGGVIASPAPGSDGLYPYMSTVTLTVWAASDFSFERWEGDLVSTENPLILGMDRNWSLTARFASQPLPSFYRQALMSGWNLVTLSLESDLPPSQLFGPSFRVLFRWDPLNGRYLVPSTLSPGQSCWVNMLTTATVTIQGSVLPPPFLLTLSRGWEMIGNPFPLSIPCNRVTATKGGQELSLGQAQDTGWIGPAYSWSGTAYLNLDFATGSWLPGQGFWLRVLQSGVSLKWTR